MEQHPEYGMTYTAFERILMDGTHIESKAAELSGSIHQELLWGKQAIGTPCIMIRHDVIDQIGTFDTSLTFTEDIDYFLRIARHFEIRAMNEILVQVRLHNDDNFLRDPEMVLREMTYIYKKNLDNYSWVFRNQIYANLYFHLLQQYFTHYPEKIGRAWTVFFRGTMRWPFGYPVFLYFFRLLFRTLMPDIVKRRVRTYTRKEQ